MPGRPYQMMNLLRKVNASRSRRASWLLGIFCLILPFVPAGSSAIDVSVSGELFSPRIAVGEPSTYAIKVMNGVIQSPPRRIEAPGLSIVYQDEQSAVTSINGVQKSQTVYFYSVTAPQVGRFTIPSVPVLVRGQEFRTEPAEITVFRPDPNDLALDASKPYFLRLTSPKREVYVGELIPIDLTVYVRGRGNLYDIGPAPRQAGGAFVIKGFSRNPVTRRLDIDGLEYTSAKLTSAAFAIQEGDQTLGPMQLNTRLLESSGRSGFGLRSIFTQTVTRTLTSNPLPITVKPLPLAGRPEGFTGAVGQFKMEVNASPLDVQTGDPISVDLRLSGIGNFDNLDAPRFTGDAANGWRTYDARRIEDPSPQSDGVTEGHLNFTQILIPQKAVSQIPPFELAFFNPETGLYEMLRTEAVPIQVKPESISGAAAAVAMTGGQGGAFSGTTPVPQARYEDILDIHTHPPRWQDLPMAATKRPTFWLVQILPLLLVMGLIGVAGTRRWRRWQEGRPQPDARPSLAALCESLDGKSESPAAFYQTAAQALDLWTDQHGATEAALPAALATDLERVREQIQGVLYAGKSTGKTPAPSDDQRKLVRQTLRGLCELKS